MTTNQVDNFVGKKVKIIFKKHDERLPIIGYFVKLKDHSDLEKKGMFRFVGGRHIDYHLGDETPVGVTRIFVVSDISQLLVVNG